jgi:hypothetical protein
MDGLFHGKSINGGSDDYLLVLHVFWLFLLVWDDDSILTCFQESTSPDKDGNVGCETVEMWQKVWDGTGRQRYFCRGYKRKAYIDS